MNSNNTVITVEYNQLTYDHPSMKTMTPSDFRLARTGKLPGVTIPRRYSAILAISCVDHDGLGRYGDPLAPDGDLMDMDEFRTWLKPNGLLFLAVPVGADLLIWNLHRRYGPVRLPLLLDGWKQAAAHGYEAHRLNESTNYLKRYEPIFVLNPQSKPKHPKTETTSASDINDVPPTPNPSATSDLPIKPTFTRVNRKDEL
jgi:hypothetical protein